MVGPASFIFQSAVLCLFTTRDGSGRLPRKACLLDLKEVTATAEVVTCALCGLSFPKKASLRVRRARIHEGGGKQNAAKAKTAAKNKDLRCQCMTHAMDGLPKCKRCLKELVDGRNFLTAFLTQHVVCCTPSRSSKAIQMVRIRAEQLQMLALLGATNGHCCRIQTTICGNCAWALASLGQGNPEKRQDASLPNLSAVACKTSVPEKSHEAAALKHV